MVISLSYLLKGVLSPTLLHPPEQVEMSAAEQTELGYMPLRDDFEKVRIIMNLNTAYKNLKVSPRGRMKLASI